jgi:hypothetical protein
MIAARGAARARHVIDRTAAGLAAARLDPPYGIDSCSRSIHACGKWLKPTCG